MKINLDIKDEYVEGVKRFCNHMIEFELKYQLGGEPDKSLLSLCNQVIREINQKENLK